MYIANDDPRNGIALCHLCHWTFDQGLITVNGRYTVVTSPQLTTTPNVPGHLLTLAGPTHLLARPSHPSGPT